jgi:hypothetical protein
VGRIFLLSPASASGRRAQMLLSGSSRLAETMRDGSAEIGEVFTFLSGLYFRGKLAYARAFARPPSGTSGIWVITPNMGLVEPEAPIDLARLRMFAEVDIADGDQRFRRPLTRDAKRLAKDRSLEVVLLGSIATAKYTSLLLEIFGDRLSFPADFVGRGDMSRGGLLLRSVDARRELPYVLVRGAVVHGARPPKLERRA